MFERLEAVTELIEMGKVEKKRDERVEKRGQRPRET